MQTPYSKVDGRRVNLAISHVKHCFDSHLPSMWISYMNSAVVTEAIRVRRRHGAAHQLPNTVTPTWGGQCAILSLSQQTVLSQTRNTLPSTAEVDAITLLVT